MSKDFYEQNLEKTSIHIQRMEKARGMNSILTPKKISKAKHLHDSNLESALNDKSNTLKNPANLYNKYFQHKADALEKVRESARAKT